MLRLVDDWIYAIIRRVKNVTDMFDDALIINCTKRFFNI